MSEAEHDRARQAPLDADRTDCALEMLVDLVERQDREITKLVYLVEQQAREITKLHEWVLRLAGIVERHLGGLN